MKDKKVSGISHYGFTKGKSCLTNWLTSVIAFKLLTLWIRKADYVYLVSHKVFNSVSHSVLVAEQVRHDLDRHTTKYSGISSTTNLKEL